MADMEFDELIRVARENDMKLGVLWFTSWKNGFSPHAPMWVLNDTKRFIRVKDQKGQNTRTLTPLCIAARDADAKAFAALMKHGQHKPSFWIEKINLVN